MRRTIVILSVILGAFLSGEAQGAPPPQPATGTPPDAGAEPAPPPAATAPAPASPAAPVPAPPAASEEVSKVECVSHHEEAQLARRQGRLLDARGTLQLCSRASCPGAIRGDCVDWLEQVNRSLPSVVVTARARGADVTEVKVRVDGKLVAERLSGAALELDPGEHRFQFETPLWPPVERTILVSEGVKGRAIDVEFSPPLPALFEAVPSPTPPGLRPLQDIDYLLGGAALVSLGTFATFGSWSLYEHNRLMEECAPFCAPNEVDPLRWKMVVADVALGVAVVSLAVGGYIYASRASEPRRAAGTTARRPSVAVGFGAQGGGLRLTGAF